MDNKLLIELESYIDKHKTDNLIIREVNVNQDHIMPMQSFRQVDKAGRANVLSKDSGKENKDFLKQFHKKSMKEKSDSEYYSIRLDEENLTDYVNNEKNKETFSTMLLRYIDKSGLSDAQIYKRAGIDRRHFSKIRCDKKYQPKKATALALCIALELDMEETNEMLQIAGYTLTNSDTGDLVVKFCIERKIYDLIEVNEALGYFGEKMLGVVG